MRFISFWFQQLFFKVVKHKTFNIYIECKMKELNYISHPDVHIFACLFLIVEQVVRSKTFVLGLCSVKINTHNNIILNYLN